MKPMSRMGEAASLTVPGTHLRMAGREVG
jgi:hypothetical protein